MEDYVADLVVIWQLEDYVTVDDVNIFYVKNMSCMSHTNIAKED
jgi:hypothetical protein